MDGGREPAPGPSRSVPRAPAAPPPRTSVPSGSSHDQCLHDHAGHQHGHESDEGGPELEPQPWGDHEARSEEHTSELQSRLHLVCRLLLEKKKKKANTTNIE